VGRDTRKETHTQPLAISRSVKPIDLWTLCGLTYSLENGGLPCICSSNYKDSELGVRDGDKVIGDIMEIGDRRAIVERSQRTRREIGDRREIGTTGKAFAFAREKSEQGILEWHLWGLRRWGLRCKN